MVAGTWVPFPRTRSSLVLAGDDTGVQVDPSALAEVQQIVVVQAGHLDVFHQLEA